MTITTLRFLLISLVTIGLSACYGNPNHSPPMIGEVIITKNDNQALCFAPNLNNVDDGNEYVSLPYINMTSMVIRSPLPFNEENTFIQSTISTKKKYYKMDENSKICLDNIPEALTYEIKEPFDLNKSYAVYISGLNNKKSKKIQLSKEFSYPIE